MANISVLARDWIVKIGSVQIKGLDTITFGSEVKEADMTTNDSAGFQEHQIAERGNTLKIEGQYVEDESTGAQDPGQVAVEALALLVGKNSLGTFSITDPANKVRTFKASVKLSDLGGKGSEASKWGCEIKVSGQITVTTGS